MKIGRNPAREKRNDAVEYARGYGRVERWDMMVAWIERAVHFHPLTELQLWSIRQITGPYKFYDLNLDRFETEKGKS